MKSTELRRNALDIISLKTLRSPQVTYPDSEPLRLQQMIEQVTLEPSQYPLN